MAARPRAPSARRWSWDRTRGARGVVVATYLLERCQLLLDSAAQACERAAGGLQVVPRTFALGCTVEHGSDRVADLAVVPAAQLHPRAALELGDRGAQVRDLLLQSLSVAVPHLPAALVALALRLLEVGVWDGPLMHAAHQGREHRPVDRLRIKPWRVNLDAEPPAREHEQAPGRRQLTGLDDAV